MNIKAIDIARALGISKSTVSLALNGKPGVSEETRKEVLECKKKLEEGESLPGSQERPTGKQIKIVRVVNGMKNIRGAEMDLWTDVNMVFEKNFRAGGYSLGLLYADFREKDQSRMIQECNAKEVAGVLIFGTELKPENAKLLEGIQKPLVIYDAVLHTDQYPTVLIDNRQGIALAVEELISHGNQDLIYLSNSMPMYNYLSRQRGFLEIMKDRGFGDVSDRIVHTGSSIEEVHQFMKGYLQKNRLPQAFLTESYHVSIGTMMALQELGIRVPEEVSLAGIDALPSYLTGGMALTSVRVPHTERAYWTVQLLLKEISHPVKEKCKLYINCELVKGETVRTRKPTGGKNHENMEL